MRNAGVVWYVHSAGVKLPSGLRHARVAARLFHGLHNTFRCECFVRFTFPLYGMILTHDSS